MLTNILKKLLIYKKNIIYSLNLLKEFTYLQQKKIYHHLMNLNYLIKFIRQIIYKLNQIKKDNVDIKIINTINCKVNTGNSKYERKIYNHLKNLIHKCQIIYFEHEKLLPVKYKRPLRADFYIVDNNLKPYIIEFNGTQHYSHNKLFHKNTSLETINIRDNIKKKYCNKNNIKFLTIPFYQNNLIQTIDDFIFN